MRSLFSFASRDIAIDLGTANTVVYLAGTGIIASEPSVVAMETINGVRKVRAVGDDAKLMMGEAPAERVKLEIGTARVRSDSPQVVCHVRGRDVGRGGPSEITLDQTQVAEALSE